jgi:hypothetical protein
MKRTECAVLVAFAAAVFVGQGCSNDERHQFLDLDGKLFTETFSCNQAFTGQPAFCSDLNRTDQIQFARTGLNSYEVRNVPDTGFLIEGDVSGLVFFWGATSPNGYSENGTWTFSPGGASYSGPSHYLADDGTYSGDCYTNGARGLSTPPDPPLPPGCP